MAEWKPPRQITFGSGNKRLRVPVKVVTLAEFMVEIRRHCAHATGRVPKSLACGECGAIYLREDRRRHPGFRHDLTHEMDHFYIDWRGAFYEP